MWCFAWLSQAITWNSLEQQWPGWHGWTTHRQPFYKVFRRKESFPCFCYLPCIVSLRRLQHGHPIVSHTRQYLWPCQCKATFFHWIPRTLSWPAALLQGHWWSSCFNHCGLCGRFHRDQPFWLPFARSPWSLQMGRFVLHGGEQTKHLQRQGAHLDQRRWPLRDEDHDGEVHCWHDTSISSSWSLVAR